MMIQIYQMTEFRSLLHVYPITIVYIRNAVVLCTFPRTVGVTFLPLSPTLSKKGSALLTELWKASALPAELQKALALPAALWKI